MVEFVSVENVVALLRAKGPETVLAGLVDYLEADFRRWETFEKSARLASHSPHGVIELMPVSDGSTYGFKYVNGHPRNTSDNLLTVTAFGVLADVATGYPTFLSEMTITTALRTAATSALAAKHLARKDSRTMALIGLGAQSEFQALAFKAVMGIADLRVFDIDPAATAKFRRNLEGWGFRIVEAASIADAVRGVDIVTTATAAKSRATILTPGMIEAGMHLNAVGGDCPGKTELHADILRGARVFVEYPAQSRIEGEIQQLEATAPVVELWRVVTGQDLGRLAREDVTVFDSVGFAIEDLSALRYLRDQVTGTGFSRRLDLVPHLSDPKDLFGLIATATPHQSRVSASTAPGALPRRVRSIQAPSDVVMMRPHRFHPNPETAADNAFQRSSAGHAAGDLAHAARAEVDAAADTLRSAGVGVIVFDDHGERGTPDSVFPNNWFSTHGGGHIAIYPMLAPSRRRERRTDVIELLKAEYRVQDVIDYSALENDGLFLEGTGAMVLDHISRIAYVARSNRADPIALERFCTHFNFEPMAFQANDRDGRPIYHTNVLMCVATEFALVGLGMITDPARRAQVRARLEETGREVIELDHEQIAAFAGNAIELSGPDGRLLALSQRARAALRADQVTTIESSARLLPIAVPTIELAGGSIRCMLAGIHLARR